jgi:hypothetical protein
MSVVLVENEAPWRAGFRSARANLLPGLVLQGLALGLVLSYYRNHDARLLLDRLAAWRQEVGVGFAIVSTGLFGGLLPVLYLKAWPSTRGTYTWAQGAMITLFWSYKGLEVDLLYRFLARFFGPGHDVATIAGKTIFDQFIYCPLFAVPVTVLVYQWTSEHFNGGAVRRDIRAGGWVHRKILPLLISNLWVWLPTACIIYSLPTGLQLPLQNLVLCFFTLLVAHQTKRAV